ncbi:CPBP family intramembrane metalloprotease [Protaetiibacter sp. SSC-01]|uniref:CPBP family intramembrane glutamic endopeptidase n=1 Tax=Protaetiibacter sp. SSC-01 TaxID=2759943 RepID=UPI0016575DD5|nr:type II CAAX endopeptidase family protein [Protaetiibacter sp. SSC-01]QNO36880.1 CPBP family intramembrane metalloprotease [Protaetiibacter sp. SSC-01]
MDLQLLALLLVVVTLLVWRAVNRERREYAQFKRMRATARRQKVMRRWLVESALVFGGLSGAVLLATWDLVPVALADAQEWAPIAASRAFFLDTVIGRVLVIVGWVLLAVALVLPFLLLRNADADDVPKLGDIGALLPRTRGELPYGAGLALSAGVFEETMFRLALPTLLFGIVPNGPLAFAIASMLFGALHLYQKWVGVLTATLLGVVFAYLYLVSGTILVPIVVHVLVDLRSLVLLPLVLGKVWTKP